MTPILKLVISSIFGMAAIGPACAYEQSSAKYAAKVPSYITTPDTVQTRIGTLKFFDGLPDPETVQKVYDNLDLHVELRHFFPAYLPRRSTRHARVSARRE